MKVLCRALILAIVTAAAAGRVSAVEGLRGDPLAEADAAFARGDYPRAALLLERQVDAAPGDAGLRLSLAVTLLQMKDPVRAIPHLDAVLRMAPGAGVVRRLRDSAENSAVQRGLKTPRPLVLSAPKAPERAGQDTSLQLLRDAAKRYPGNAALANLLADACQLSGDLKCAEEWYLKASALAPRWTKPRVGLAIAVLDSDPPRAANLLEAVLEKEPMNAQARLWLGDAYARLGRLEDAMRCYRAAEASPETRPDAKVRIGTLLVRTSQVPRALEEFQQATEQDPGNVAALAGVAQSNVLLNRPEEARQAIEQSKNAARETAPQTRARLYNVTGAVQISLGAHEPAIADLEKATALEPENQDAYARLARAYREAGTLGAEIQRRERQLRSAPGDTRLLRFLAEAYAEAGDHRRQIAALDRLASLDPAGAWLWRMREGEARWSLGERERALEAWLAAVDTGYPTRTEAIARSILASGDASGFVTASLQRRPATARGLHLLYALAESGGDLHRALELLDRVITLDPGNASLYGQKGYLLRKMGRLEDAEQALRIQRSMDAGAAPSGR
ncbi:MAG: tetratricopeptide repeat protein [Armatimonadota bacterium]